MLVFRVSCITIILIAFLLVAAFAVGCVGMDLQVTALSKDQLAELGGGQTCDWIALNRKVVDSGIKYGIGVLEGPYVRKVQVSGWMLEAEPTQNPTTGQMLAGTFRPSLRDPLDA